MKVHVLYFAAVRELLGVDEEWLDVPSDVVDVRAFRTFLVHAHPELGGTMRHVRVAKNEAFAQEDEPISQGDVLALIPPVAGG